MQFDKFSNDRKIGEIILPNRVLYQHPTAPDGWGAALADLLDALRDELLEKRA